MNVAIVKYNAGNVCSVANALHRIGVTPILTAEVDALRSADCVIFPGVGEAATTMRHLKQTGLDEVIKSLRQPVLGICLGMQLMCARSDEGDVACLGIFDVPVRRFVPTRPADKVPHMGWNTIRTADDVLFSGFTTDEYVYFVHSYYVPVCVHTAAVTDYIQPFSAALRKDNFFATQFHPEKSGEAGERILRNFLHYSSSL